jgi:hypothetical protein
MKGIKRITFALLVALSSLIIMAGSVAAAAPKSGPSGVDEQGQSGQVDIADNQSGTDEMGQVGESGTTDSAENQKGNNQHGNN